MKISIVTSLYYSAPYLQEFYDRTLAAVRKLGAAYELVFVVDGSPDNSLEVARGLSEKDHRIKIVELARNYGEHKALLTGLAHAKADYHFIIDCDLEEDPEWIGLFWEELEKHDDVDVVYGRQLKRKGGLFERISGYLFYSLLNLVSETRIPRNLVTARLMSQRYVENLIRHRENEITLFGIFSLTGFEQVPVAVTKKSKGKTAYNLKRKLSMAINAFVSFSSKPLIYIFNLGMLVTLIAIGLVIYTLIEKLFYGVPVRGWTSLIASLWFLGGLTLFSIGVVGIYLSKIFVEVKHRPFTIVKSVYERKPDRDSAP